MKEFSVRVRFQSHTEYYDQNCVMSRQKTLMPLGTAIEVADKCKYLADVIRERDDAMVDYMNLGITGNVISLVQAVKQG